MVARGAKPLINERASLPSRGGRKEKPRSRSRNRSTKERPRSNSNQRDPPPQHRPKPETHRSSGSSSRKYQPPVMKESDRRKTYEQSDPPTGRVHMNSKSSYGVSGTMEDDLEGHYDHDRLRTNYQLDDSGGAPPSSQKGRGRSSSQKVSKDRRRRQERSRHSARDNGIQAPSPMYRKKLNRWYENRLQDWTTALSKSFSGGEKFETVDSLSHTIGSSNDHDDDDDGALISNDCSTEMESVKKSSKRQPSSSRVVDDGLTDLSGDYLKTKQPIAYMAIGVTIVQLLVLMLQFAMCGFAPLDINAMVGPFPDAFSEWGGKNAYLMKSQNEWWRLFTPAFLHVGLLHLLANAFCQLEAIALFEREWGSFRWCVVFVVSSVGCNAFASYFDQDTISVGSSGALMGLYAAKLAQVTSAVFFDVSKANWDDAIRLDQLSSTLCGLTIVSLLSCFTYIDWSGHMGGLLCGYLSGMVLFSCTIRSCCSWFFWSALGLLGLLASLTSVIYFFVEESEPDNEIGDPCNYFRNLFPEDYVCGCMWRQ